mmetsp:Transcript_94718/g.271001  ORF Transcript_94718/g.271001 Transcript_94718/m.271001 type:complete len:86 (-) Transcript_94718:276-533(-)
MATDVRNAGCYDPNEEAKLRRVIGEVGEERFNESIIKLSKSIIKDLEKKKQASLSQSIRSFSTSRSMSRGVSRVISSRQQSIDES